MTRYPFTVHIVNMSIWHGSQLKQFAEDVETIVMCSYDMDITPEKEAEFRLATHDHICKEPFMNGDKKIRDHDHFLLYHNYRGAGHDSCNIFIWI